MEFRELSERMEDLLGVSLTSLRIASEEFAKSETKSWEKLLNNFLYIKSGKDIFQWYKCPQHGTWLQPEFLPSPHWACWFWQGCEYKRAAKMRTKAERQMFSIARHLEEHS